VSAGGARRSVHRVGRQLADHDVGAGSGQSVVGIRNLEREERIRPDRTGRQPLRRLVMSMRTGTRRLTLAAGALALGLAGLLTVACDTVPLTAPSASTV